MQAEDVIQTMGIIHVTLPTIIFIPTGYIQVETPADHECYVTSTGNIKILAQLPTQIEVHLLQNILYIPDYGSNLFSLTKVARQNKVFTLCKDNSCELIQNNTLIMTGHRI
uniref:Retrovirus-related Pol polyprotein from transposon TNT 1-94-like beta-barrel domain-containing protein n=1 Tax=Physcomitrium patens TaxID=3218 RepID=A0A2K1KQ42_PHYPA|nr:hypothetical protein PHYPA_006809 [Physcomitrium patens]